MPENHWSDLVIFKVHRHLTVPKSIISKGITFIQFKQEKEEVLIDPNTDVVGVAFWAGRRRYAWKEKWWSEYPLESKILIKRLKKRMDSASGEELQQLIDVLCFIEEYRTSPPPETIYKEDGQRLNAKFSFCNKQLVISPYIEEIGPKLITRVVYEVHKA